MGYYETIKTITENAVIYSYNEEEGVIHKITGVTIEEPKYKHSKASYASNKYKYWLPKPEEILKIPNGEKIMWLYQEDDEKALSMFNRFIAKEYDSLLKTMQNMAKRLKQYVRWFKNNRIQLVDVKKNEFRKEYMFKED